MFAAGPNSGCPASLTPSSFPELLSPASSLYRSVGSLITPLFFLCPSQQQGHLPRSHESAETHSERQPSREACSVGTILPCANNYCRQGRTGCPSLAWSSKLHPSRASSRALVTVLLSYTQTRRPCPRQRSTLDAESYATSQVCRGFSPSQQRHFLVLYHVRATLEEDT